MNIYNFASRSAIDLAQPLNASQVVAPKGVVTGCNRGFEWLLPWWWHHYSKHNSYPVAFADAGLSPKMREWCLARGHVLNIGGNPILKGDAQDKVFGIEHGWKPFAPLFAPFEHIAWIDLDCEIIGDIGEIFDYANKMALAKDPYFHLTPLGQQIIKSKEISIREQAYNSGVIAAKQGSWLLRKWAEVSIHGPQGWRVSDQHILQGLVFKNPGFFEELPERFNKLAPHMYNIPINDSVILHRLASHPFTMQVLRQQAARLNKKKPLTKG